MILTALLLLAAPPAPLPPVPDLASGEFKQAIVQTRRLLAEGKFEEAAKAANVFPTDTLRIQWDDSAAPADHKPVLELGRNEAFRSFENTALKGKVILTSDKPDIKVTFTDRLPYIEGSKRRQGAVFFVSFDPNDVRVEAVIALERGLPPRRAERRDVAGEVLHAMGLALGMAKLPREGGAMGRTDGSFRLPPKFIPSEILVLGKCREVIAALRQRVQAKVKEPIGDDPHIVLDTTVLAAGEALQGGEMQMSFQVSNQGKSDLRFTIVPDCACFMLRYNGVVKPGEDAVVQVGINTRDFPGPLNKSIYLYTNDPDRSVIQMPATGKVTPIYRFLSEAPDSVVLMGEKAKVVTYYLTHPKGRPWEILSAEVSGSPASISWEPWSGVLADPEYDESAVERTGFKLILKLEPRKEPGRFPITLQLRTSDPDFPVFATSVTGQRGIVSLPATFYMGEIPAKPSAGWVQVVRPGSPFKVLGIRTDSEYITAKVEPLDDLGYRLLINFNGKAPEGLLNANIFLTTDDPFQKEIVVPVSGVIK